MRPVPGIRDRLDGMKRTAGFTLVELAVLMVVLGIMIAIAVPSVQKTIDSYRLKTAAAEMATNIRLAGQESISRELEYRIEFNIAGNRYTVFQMVYGGDVEIECVEIRDQVSMTGTGFSSNQLIFGKQGRPSESGDITLTSDLGQVRRVSVDESGRVAVVD